MNLHDGICAVPVMHGRAAFARYVRNLCGRHRFDCVAVDLPSVFDNHVRTAVEYLPCISAIVARAHSDPVYYLPADPCDAAVEAIRQALQRRIPSFCVGPAALYAPRPLPPLPDEYAITRLGFDAFAALCLRTIGNPPEGSEEDLAARSIAHRLLECRLRHKSILACVHMRRFARVVHHLGRETTHNAPQPGPAPSYRIDTFSVNPDHLYFVLGELPFIVSRCEKERYDALAAPADFVDLYKELFRDTRENYSERGDNMDVLSPARLQAALVFLRNLTVMDSRFLPSLFDIVSAAKGVGGNTFALRVLKNAKYYPFLPFEHHTPVMSAGIDRISIPPDMEVHTAVNVLRDTALVWKTLGLKPDPSEMKKRQYRYAWNTAGMCSHVPEDRHIERFNSHVRTRAQRAAVEDMVKSERFTTSVKDGVDVRETLRNWYTGDVYVKEIPPSRGPVDTVVIIFDDRHDGRYPQHTTWYAEHHNESTLTFYATDPFADLIGPGIARCFYGGLSLLFPPRLVPDTFELTRDMDLPGLSHRLVWGALAFSREKSVAYVARARPGVRMRMMAQKLGKQLVWIPLAAFSTETLHRLRRFHVLNGRTVRSWAARFIGE
jgi:hypothetical protein